MVSPSLPYCSGRGGYQASFDLSSSCTCLCRASIGNAFVLVLTTALVVLITTAVWSTHLLTSAVASDREIARAHYIVPTTREWSANALENGIHPTKNGIMKKDTSVQHHSSKSRVVIRRMPNGERPRIAYGWLLGGIHQDVPGYRGYLYTIFMAAHRLIQLGSRADFYIWVQVHPNCTWGLLPMKERKILEGLGVNIIMLEQPQTQSFASLVYEKFRILQLTDYERVVFLDADMVPLRNLDYVMDASIGPSALLQPNLIIATRQEPCNAGIFMLAPVEGHWKRLWDVVHAQWESAKNLPYPKFDEIEGWGHSFKKANDKWRAVKNKGARWNYWASHSDQGLLYQWAKYEVQNVSIAIGHQVENWEPGTNGQPLLKTQLDDPLDVFATISTNYTGQTILRCGNQQAIKRWSCALPYRDIVHYYQKPWMEGTSFKRFWFDSLAEINVKLGLGLDTANRTNLLRHIRISTPLGSSATFNDHAKDMEVYHAEGGATD